ncbi:MAG TPA: biosynthetic-type acetolactate synthase large subunit [Clostridia bacterium]|nr:biosynthetic-type acetolactate synthase large subunit [Clostridia bacterium]
MKLNGSQIVLKVLQEQGVDTVFGYPGGTILNIYDELFKTPSIKHIMTAHEQGAAHAADGYARATGKTGVVMATSGPGSTNLVTGIATAYMDSIPLVAITANVPNSMIGRDSFQEIYITGITMPITKHNMVVRSVDELAHTLREAFRIAGSGCPGPVLVDIPKDVTAAVCEFYEPVPDDIREKACPAINPKVIEETARLINAAKRPMVHFGGGVIAANGSDKLYEMIHKASLPACHTIMGTGVLSYEDPLNIGMIGMHGNISSALAVSNADVLVVIGARFSDRVATNPAQFAADAKIIHIDIDCSEMNKNVMVDHFITGDVGAVLDALLPLIEKNDHPEWLEQINAWRKQDQKPQFRNEALCPSDMMTLICDIAGEDAIIVTDVGQHQMWAAQYCKRTRPRSFLTSGGLGTMGFGYGAACGAQVAFPGRRVVHITGDGCFHMNLNELCTSVSYNLPIVTVVMNNRVLGMVRQWQTLFYGNRYAATDPERKTDFAAVADAFGAKGYHADTIAGFEACFKEALASGRTCVIDCLIDKDEMVMPMIPGGASVKEAILNAPK